MRFRHASKVAVLLTTVGTSAFSWPFQAAEEGDGVAWWVWLLLLLLLILAVWWFLSRKTDKGTESASPGETGIATSELEVSPAVADATTIEEQSAPKVPDDLTKIEGIGPKISSVFQAAGISSFEHLAATNAERLKEILTEAGIRLGDPTTWPDQARLAAAGDWDALQSLQDDLMGGRRE